MTQSGLRTNMYCINIGYSGSGKNSPFQILPKLIPYNEEASTVFGPNEITSSSAIWKALEVQPAFMLMLDEIGMFFRGIKNPNSPHHLSDIGKLLTILFTGTDSGARKAYAQAEQTITLHWHHLSILGASTPSEFWKGMKMDDAVSGFLARMLLFDSRQNGAYPNYDLQPVDCPNLTHELCGIHKIETEYGGGNISRIPKPHRIPMTPEAAKMHKEWHTEYLENRNKCNVNDDPKGSFYGRAGEHAMKLALIHALSLYGANIIRVGEVREESVTWATAVVDFLIGTAIRNMAEHVVENKTEEERKKILKVVSYKATPERPGATASEIKRKCMGIENVDAHLRTLVQSGFLKIMEWKNPKGGPSTQLFCPTNKRW
jgi:hypothetical protein